MPNLGMPEILLILVVALLVFGPRKLPEMGKSIGQALREFRKHTSAVTDELRTGLAEVPPVAATVAQPPVSAPPLSVQAASAVAVPTHETVVISANRPAEKVS